MYGGKGLGWITTDRCLDIQLRHTNVVSAARGTSLSFECSIFWWLALFCIQDRQNQQQFSLHEPQSPSRPTTGLGDRHIFNQSSHARTEASRSCWSATHHHCLWAQRSIVLSRRPPTPGECGRGGFRGRRQANLLGGATCGFCSRPLVASSLLPKSRIEFAPDFTHP